MRIAVDKTKKPVQLPPDEVADKIAIEREKQMQEIAWAHLEGAHERFLTNTEAGHLSEADTDSDSVFQWLHTYRNLLGDGPAPDTRDMTEAE